MKTINTLMKEIEEDANKLKDIPKKLILLKYPYYSKPSIDSMQSL